MICKTGKKEVRRPGFSARIAVLRLVVILSVVGAGMSALCGCSRSGKNAPAKVEADESMDINQLMAELVKADEEVNEAWSKLDVQLQRRNDLIPNLVSIVKGYAPQEEDVFSAVADARGKLAGASTLAEKAEADAALSISLGRLLAIAENYPELKADENFLRLQDELAGTENRIMVARNFFNEKVKNFNARLNALPASVREQGGFKSHEFYDQRSQVQQL